jgi:hypothetical protein
MTPDHKAKLLAGKAARKTKLSGQLIQVNKTWSIKRLDSMNWQILENGKLPGKRVNYYGTLLAAFLDLPEKAIQSAFDNQNDSSKLLEVLKGLKIDLLKAVENYELI